MRYQQTNNGSVSSILTGGDTYENQAIKNCDDEVSARNPSNIEIEIGIDRDAVEGLVSEIKELRNGLLVLLMLFIAISGFIALDDYNSGEMVGDYREEQIALAAEEVHKAPHPHRGRKLQINASTFTVNDFECLQLDTGNWPSERVHCELQKSFENVEGTNEDYDDDVARYDFVVEHFDDDNCEHPNADNPIVRHTASGCYFFEAYNHSYNDLCHMNRTLTISAFYGPGCLIPMPVTAVNVLPEDVQ